jgi:hypothetical protein
MARILTFSFLILWLSSPAVASNYVCQFGSAHSAVLCVNLTGPVLVKSFDVIEPEILNAFVAKRQAYLQSIAALEPFRVYAESFRGFLESIRVEAEAERTRNPTDLGVYEAMLAFYRESTQVYLEMLQHYTGEVKARRSRSYSCGFDAEYILVVCRIRGSDTAYSEFPLRIGKRVSSKLRADNGYTLTRRDARYFRVECEDYRSSLEELRAEAEALRLSRPDDTPLYHELIRFYGHGFSYYKALHQEYREVMRRRIPL